MNRPYFICGQSPLSHRGTVENRIQSLERGDLIRCRPLQLRARNSRRLPSLSVIVCASVLSSGSVWWVWASVTSASQTTPWLSRPSSNRQVKVDGHRSSPETENNRNRRKQCHTKSREFTISKNSQSFIILIILCRLRMDFCLLFNSSNSVWPERTLTTARCSETSQHPSPPRALPVE